MMSTSNTMTTTESTTTETQGAAPATELSKEI